MRTGIEWRVHRDPGGGQIPAADLAEEARQKKSTEHGAQQAQDG